MSEDLLRYRPEFPILERTTYLISNSLGAMPITKVVRLTSLRGTDSVSPVSPRAVARLTRCEDTSSSREDLDLGLKNS